MIEAFESIGGWKSTVAICPANPMLKRHKGQFLIASDSRQHLHIAI
jgi:hypothetical protein